MRRPQHRLPLLRPQIVQLPRPGQEIRVRPRALEILHPLPRRRRDDVLADDVPELAFFAVAGDEGPREPDDVGPAVELRDLLPGAGLAAGGVVVLGDDGGARAGGDVGVVVAAEGCGLGWRDGIC